MEGLAIGLGLTSAAVVKLCCGSPSLFYAKPDTVLARVERLAEMLGMTFSAFVRAAQLRPAAFNAAPEDAEKRLTGSAERLGVSSTEYKAMCRRCIGLIWLRPEAAKERLETLCRLFGVEAVVVRRMLRRCPFLLLLCPLSIERFLVDGAAILDVERDAWRRVVIRESMLIMSSLAAFERNIAGLARELGLAERNVVQLALRCPPLLYLAPTRIAERVRLIASLIDAPVATVVAAFSRSPSLFVREAGSLLDRLRVCQRTAAHLGEHLSLAEVLVRDPTALTYDMHRLRERYLLVRLGLWSGSWMTVLKLGEERLHAALVRHGQRFPAGGRQARRLEAMLQCSSGREERAEAAA